MATTHLHILHSPEPVPTAVRRELTPAPDVVPGVGTPLRDDHGPTATAADRVTAVVTRVDTITALRPRTSSRTRLAIGLVVVAVAMGVGWRWRGNGRVTLAGSCRSRTSAAIRSATPWLSASPTKPARRSHRLIPST